MVSIWCEHLCRDLESIWRSLETCVENRYHTLYLWFSLIELLGLINTVRMWRLVRACVCLCTTQLCSTVYLQLYILNTNTRRSLLKCFTRAKYVSGPHGWTKTLPAETTHLLWIKGKNFPQEKKKDNHFYQRSQVAGFTGVSMNFRTL